MRVLTNYVHDPVRYQYKYLIVFDMVYRQRGAMVLRWIMTVWLLRAGIKSTKYYCIKQNSLLD